MDSSHSGITRLLCEGTVLALQRILAFLGGTRNKQLEVKRTTFTLFSDSDYVGDRKVNHTNRVTSVILLCNGMPIHWTSNRQPVSSPIVQYQNYMLYQKTEAGYASAILDSRWLIVSQLWYLASTWLVPNRIVLIKICSKSSICEYKRCYANRC